MLSFLYDIDVYCTINNFTVEQNKLVAVFNLFCIRPILLSKHGLYTKQNDLDSIKTMFAVGH